MTASRFAPLTEEDEATEEHDSSSGKLQRCYTSHTPNSQTAFAKAAQEQLQKEMADIDRSIEGLQPELSKLNCRRNRLVIPCTSSTTIRPSVAQMPHKCPLPVPASGSNLHPRMTPTHESALIHLPPTRHRFSAMSCNNNRP